MAQKAAKYSGRDRPDTIGPMTFYQINGREITAPTTTPGGDGRVFHFGHHPATGPDCEPSRLAMPSDYLRLSINIRRRSGVPGPVSVQVRVRTSDGESADPVFTGLFNVTPDTPTFLLEVRGVVSQNPWEVEFIPQTTDEFAASISALVGFCCHAPSIVTGPTLTSTAFAIISATLAPGGADMTNVETLLDLIYQRQANETQKTQLVGLETNGNTQATEAAQLVYTGGNNEMTTAHSVAAVDPLQMGLFRFVSSNAPGSLAVPANCRVQRIVTVGDPASDPTASFSATVGGFTTARVPKGLLHEIKVLGRCSRGGTVLCLNVLWWGVEYTLDP